MYGSELSGIQLSNLGAHLIDRQLARDVPLEDRRCGIGRLESFQSHRTDRAPDASAPLSPLPIRNGRDANGHNLDSQSDFITRQGPIRSIFSRLRRKLDQLLKPIHNHLDKLATPALIPPKYVSVLL